MKFRLEPVYRFCAKWLIRLFYKVEYRGFEKISPHSPIILIANHVSYIDGLLIQAGVDRPVRFIIDDYIYRLPVIYYFMRYNRAIPILAKKHHVEAALDTISQGLEYRDAICLFPEGRLTATGNLGRFKPGIEWIIERDPVLVYPIAISGVWGSIFSRKYVKSRWRWLPRKIRRKVVLICGDPIHPADIQVNHLQRVILSLKHILDQAS